MNAAAVTLPGVMTPVDPASSLPPRFVTWRAVPKPDGKIDKIPLDLAGNPSDCNSPANWLSYAEAVATGRPLGFVFNGDGYVALDPDSCRNAETDDWHPDALTLFQKFAGAMVEISMSGRGGHIIGRIDNPEEYAAKGSVSFNGLPRVDWFNRTGFVAFGPHGWQHNPHADITQAFGEVVTKTEETAPVAMSSAGDPRWTLAHLSDDEIIAKMLSSKGSTRAQFGSKASATELWNADPVALPLHFPHDTKLYDTSDAHFALMGLLAYWFGRCPARMIAAFDKSKLAQDEKWKRQKYRATTVGNILKKHGSVYDLTPKAEREVIGLPALTRTFMKLPSLAEIVSTAAAPSVSPAKWMSIVSPDDLDMRGKPVPNLRNTLIALRNDPNLWGTVGFDEMEQCTMVTGHLPRVDRPRPANDAPVTIVPLADHHVSYVLEYLQATGMPKLTGGNVSEALGTFARDRSYHPVADYLNNIRWDGAQRLSSWLSTFCGVEASDYTSAVGRKWFISAVARIFEPGCQVDTTLILEGPQGARKSTVVRTLAGVWFSDNLPDITRDSKELSQHLRGKWIVEIPEMAALYRSNAKVLKAFLSRTVEKYRPSYGRLDVTEPRQCLFIATTNESEYLRDDTGARRFWPVTVGARCDTDALARDRDQLFAEAVAAFRSGERWWLDEVQEADARVKTAERQIEDPWQSAVATYLDGRLAIDPYCRLTVNNVAVSGLAMDIKQVGRLENSRIQSILRVLGWEKAPKVNGASTYRRHVRGDIAA
ncbi:VapE domain-containing protein [Aminobacter aminovorans]|uniref:phage NrS-1 polymerase family protein n=1 Tax=Aminobacter aminovorans TaxID=83263 RepID=UPI0028570F90|nr:VapE domain-containing protein [Aminobacter aminovorans]MDR7219868.1 putative P-loop ATPase [Aminobacter aminovorans]